MPIVKFGIICANTMFILSITLLITSNACSGITPESFNGIGKLPTAFPLLFEYLKNNGNASKLISPEFFVLIINSSKFPNLVNALNKNTWYLSLQFFLMQFNNSFENTNDLDVANAIFFATNKSFSSSFPVNTVHFDLGKKTSDVLVSTIAVFLIFSSPHSYE